MYRFVHVEAPNWRTWCRLCAKSDARNVSIFCKTESGHYDTTLAMEIRKFFCVIIKPNEDFPTYICSDCQLLIDWLVQFNDHISNVQKLFSTLSIEQVKGVEAVKNCRIRCGVTLNERTGLFERLKNALFGDQRLTFKNTKNDGVLEMEMSQAVNDTEKEVVHTQTKRRRSPQIVKVHLENGNVVHIIKDQPELAVNIEEESINESELYDEGGEGGEENELSGEGGEENELSGEGGEENELSGEGGEELELSGEGVEESEPGEDQQMVYEEIEYAEVPDIVDDDLENTFIFNKVESVSKHEEEDENQDQEVGEEYEDNDPYLDPKYDPNSMDEQEYLTDAEHEGDASSAGIADVLSISADLMCRKRGRPKNSPFKEGTTEIYSCKDCDKTYRNPTSYRKHCVTQHAKEADLPEYKCEKCDKTFPTMNQLRLHFRTHLPLEMKLDIPCPYCTKKFSKLTVMRQHVSSVHQNRKPFVCDQCGRCAKTMAGLNEHMLVHTDNCPFECETCHKRFKNKARLKLHQDTHAEVPHICTLCGLKLNTIRTLKMHMLVHTEEREFKCDFCDAAFKRTKALKNHLLLHTGMRPYKCNFCPKTFSNGSNCRSHKRKKHAKELEEEERLGIKKEKTRIPKLEELRNSKLLEEAPRQVTRFYGGLSLRKRALLIANEERMRIKQEKRKRSSTIVRSETQNAAESNVVLDSDQNETDPIDTEVVEIDENSTSLMPVQEGDEEEEVIYEYIDELYLNQI